MKKILLVAITLLLFVTGLFAQIKEPVPIGFNHGQIHHFAQMRFQDNGKLPNNLIDSIKNNVPFNMRNICRMSGTMSNYWALDLPGYNYYIHDNQIDNNRNVGQPEFSYIYAFLDFYKKWGYKELIWTLNTHSPYINVNERKLWEERMWNALYYLIKNGVNITYVCLENEWYLDWRVCGLSSGSLNAGDKTRLAGNIGGVFRTNNSFEGQVKNTMRDYMNYLKPIADSIRKVLPNAKLLIGADNLSAARGRWMWDVIKEYNFYDGIDIHIYITPKNQKETNTIVANRIKSYNYPNVYVMECNYQYAKETDWEYPGFRTHLLDACVKNGAKAVMYHTSWAWKSAYGWVRDK